MEHDHRSSQADIMRRTMAPIDDICELCTEITQVEEPLPLLDSAESGDDEDCTWWDAKRERALLETKKWIDR